MLNLFGFNIPLPPQLAFFGEPLPAFLINIAAWIVVAVLINELMFRPLRALAHRLPGDLEDIVLAIVRRPLIALILLYGVSQSIGLLNPGLTVRFWVQRLAYTLLILIILNMLWRAMRDVVMYYGERWARKTNTRVDDVILPMINLTGPLLLVLIGALVLLPLWGVNIASVLVGAGVVGLIVGLALQDTLGNVFSGISLLIEAPFSKGDLLLLPDNRRCEVVRLGLRSTLLYSIDEHASVYIPNRILASAILTNVTRPTLDQRFLIEIEVDNKTDVGLAQELLRRAAVAHPATLVTDIDEKIHELEELVADTRRRAAGLPAGSSARARMELEAKRNELMIPRLELEHRLIHQVETMMESLRELLRALRKAEESGLTRAEIRDVLQREGEAAGLAVEGTAAVCGRWFEMADPWLADHDQWDLREIWQTRNARLLERWDQARRALEHPDEINETRLDDRVRELLQWVEEEYKTHTPYWKNPTVTITGFSGSGAKLALWYYVDNIRLEHEERARRVQTEIAQRVRVDLEEASIW